MSGHQVENDQAAPTRLRHHQGHGGVVAAIVDDPFQSQDGVKRSLAVLHFSEDKSFINDFWSIKKQMSYSGGKQHS